MLFENGLNINEISENYKKQLKILPEENIPCAKFVNIQTNQNKYAQKKRNKEKHYITHPK